MTATTNRQGHIILQTTDSDRLNVKPGDVLVVVDDHAGRIVLQKRLRKSYLTPRPLSSATINKLYAQTDTAWDKVEAESVALGRRALTGRRVEEL